MEVIGIEDNTIVYSFSCKYLSRETNSASDVGSGAVMASEFGSFSSQFDAVNAVLVGSTWPEHTKGLGGWLGDASASILGGIGLQCAQFVCISV